MRKLLVLAVLVAPLVAAQEKTITSPVSQSKLKVDTVHLIRNPAIARIELMYQDSGNADIRNFEVTVPSAVCGSASVAGLATAMITARASETGTDTRKLNFRILGYLSDNGCGIPAGTLVP